MHARVIGIKHASIAKGFIMMVLEHELKRFDRELPELLKTMRGQYVLIHGDDPLQGPYPTEDDAYEAGCEKYGIEPFLVMHVVEEQKIIPLLQDVTIHANYQPPT
jgi:hypothetical protein